MMKVSRACLTATLFGAAILGSLVLAPDSFAARRHVKLEKSSPAESEALTASPKSISLWFSEKVDLKVTTVKLADAKGVAAALGALKRDTTAKAPVVADVTKPLAPGSYTIRWSAAALDGHPEKGTIRFTVNKS